MLLFHLHFDVADVAGRERRYLEAGYELRARFGYVGREHRRFPPQVAWSELEAQGVRLRLVELERGAVNVVLMRSRFPEVRLGQVGFVADADEREAVLERARRRELRVRDHGDRVLIATGQRFDVELASDRRHAYDSAARSDLRIEAIEVGCARPDDAGVLLDDVLGGAVDARVRFVSSASGVPELRSCAFAGTSPAARVPLPL